MSGIHLLGGVAALFAAALLVLPTLRVAQGQLTPRRAAGLWLAGAGFLLLALAAFGFAREHTQATVVAGAAAAVAGNFVQRRLGAEPGAQ